MKVVASAKSVRLSPKKAREVAALVAGRNVADAVTILEHTPRRAAQPIVKVIESAKSNALHNHSSDEKSLVVERVEINTAGSMRRWRPAARGRALPYKRRFSHITVTLSGATDKPKPAVTTKSTKPPAKASKEKK